MKIVFVSGVELGRHALRGILECGVLDGKKHSLTAIFSLSPKKESETVGFRPFDDLADSAGSPLHKIAKMNSRRGLELLEEADPDIIFVIGWSELVGPEILDMPKRLRNRRHRHGATWGCVGMHPTLLPVGRGRAPLPWTIIKGFKQGAVSMFYLEEEADTGDIIAQREYSIGPRDDVGVVYGTVAQLHYEICKETLPLLVRGKAARIPQDALAKMRGVQPCYWEKRTPADGVIDWTCSAEQVRDWVRALTKPYPGAFTDIWGGRRTFVWRANLLDNEPHELEPGRMLSIQGDGVVVACGTGRVVLTEVQPDGETSSMAGAELGRRLLGEGAAGARLAPCLRPRKDLRVLAIGPHPDDIELGCAATLMRLIDEFDADCFYVVMSHEQATRNLDNRRAEAVRAAIRLGIPIDEDLRDPNAAAFKDLEFLMRWLVCERQCRLLRKRVGGRSCEPPRSYPVLRGSNPRDTVYHVTIENFHDTLFPDQWRRIQERLLEIGTAIQPNLVLVGTRDDAHQDHVTTTECADREFRRGESRWYYEVLQFDARPFIPSLFVDVEGRTVWAREVKAQDSEDEDWVRSNPLGEAVPADWLDLFDRVSNPVPVDQRGNPVDPDKARYWVHFKQGGYYERKADLLAECFRSQRHRLYFEPQRVIGSMASRGMQCGLNVKYAEAYQARISI